MKLAIGADHGGYKLKEALIKFLKAQGHEVIDMGTHTEEPCDYPLIGYEVARAVSDFKFERAILICKSGVGMSIAANKLPGIRAALCSTIEQARMSREHNDANILVLSANFTKAKAAKQIVKVWLASNFLGERHLRRVQQILDIERESEKRKAKNEKLKFKT